MISSVRKFSSARMISAALMFGAARLIAAASIIVAARMGNRGGGPGAPGARADIMTEQFVSRRHPYD